MKTKYTTREIYLTSGQVEKLTAAVAKRSSVSLMISPATSNKTAVKVMLTKHQIGKLDKGKPFVLKLSVAQITTMSHRNVVEGGFFGPALSVLLPKILPVLGTLGLAAASGAVSGATKKAVEGRGIKQISRR